MINLPQTHQTPDKLIHSSGSVRQPLIPLLSFQCTNKANTKNNGGNKQWSLNGKFRNTGKAKCSRGLDSLHNFVFFLPRIISPFIFFNYMSLAIPEYHIYQSYPGDLSRKFPGASTDPLANPYSVWFCTKRLNCYQEPRCKFLTQLLRPDRLMLVMQKENSF